MQFRFAHNNINVADIDKSVAFYQEALGLRIAKRKDAGDGSFALVFLEDGVSEHQMELTWLRDKEGPYELGDNESHTCFRVDEYDKAHEKHRQMGCICFENDAMGLYFIEDPDGYWIEIVPASR